MNKVIEFWPRSGMCIMLVQPYTRGDPMSPLRWTCKSTARLAAELTRQGHPIGTRKVAALLQELDYSLQANRKTREGTSHPDRDAQFEYLSLDKRRYPTGIKVSRSELSRIRIEPAPFHGDWNYTIHPDP